MRIERAEFRDVETVVRLLAECAKHLQDHGINQWDAHYPTVKVVENDVGAGALFVVREHGICIAAVCLNELQPDEYRSLAWRCSPDRHSPLVCASRLAATRCWSAPHGVC
jgi:hypothetical protein